MSNGCCWVKARILMSTKNMLTVEIDHAHGTSEELVFYRQDVIVNEGVIGVCGKLEQAEKDLQIALDNQNKLSAEKGKAISELWDEKERVKYLEKQVADLEYKLENMEDACGG